MSQPPPATRYASVAIDPDQVDPERVQRLDFMERDRTGTASPGVHYLEASQPTTQQYPRPHSLGVKLWSFNGKYIENVQAGISIIED